MTGITGITVSEEQRQAVEARLRRRDLTSRERERLEMVKAVALGQEVEAIVRWSGRTERTVHRWLGQWAREGIAGLADAPRPGRPRRADDAYLQALDAALERQPADLGLPFDVWTSVRLSAYLAHTTGVRIAPSWLRGLLTQRRYTYGRPKHTLKHLQDPAVTAACAHELAVVGEKGAGCAGAV